MRSHNRLDAEKTSIDTSVDVAEFLLKILIRDVLAAVTKGTKGRQLAIDKQKRRMKVDSNKTVKTPLLHPFFLFVFHNLLVLLNAMTS